MADVPDYVEMIGGTDFFSASLNSLFMIIVTELGDNKHFYRSYSCHALWSSYCLHGRHE